MIDEPALRAAAGRVVNDKTDQAGDAKRATTTTINFEGRGKRRGGARRSSLYNMLQYVPYEKPKGGSRKGKGI